ncbi:DUF6069 family protein [Streptomyces echinoruber]|uniref:Uncharacterized protein n=1 Tax=Streptomyces echinoruber TaxID=68898 RepID=A0A918RYR3_9ACTN|nr:DUF6069 family protein [Streptomyces echinoruber]GHA16520.1 hypothetical protein GCM10010389_63770 [Streptomyces echinoruber]
MTSQATGPGAGAAGRARRAARGAAVLAGAAAAVLTWLVLTRLAGVRLEARGAAGQDPQSVGAAAVVAAALVAGLAAWASLAALERLAPARARGAWLVLAAAALVLSLAGPLALGTTTGAVAGLAALHLVTGLVLIPALARTAVRP